MKLSECDSDEMFELLYDIGIDVEALGKKNPSVQRMRELYAALLHLQLFAWKDGESHRELIQNFNRSLAGKAVPLRSKHSFPTH